MNKQIRQVQCRQGFINTIIIGVIALIIAAAGYFAMTRKTVEAPATTQESEMVGGTKIEETHPKSDLLSFMKNDGSIWLIDFTNNKQATKIVDPPSEQDNFGDYYDHYRYWSLSPKGDQITFDLYRDNNLAGIAIASTDHYAQPKFLHAGSNPKWSPTGDNILFKDEGKIKLISLSDNKIKSFEGVNELLASYLWFKDGIHFLAFNRTSNNKMERYVVNKNTMKKQFLKVPELEKMKGSILYYYPIISPVTNEFVASVDYGKGYDVAVFNIDGQSLKILSPLPTKSWPGSGYISPNWSPDGRQISYVDIYCDIKSDCPSKVPPSSLIVINKDGSGRRTIIDGVVGSGIDDTISIPCWLPSGKEIVFTKRNNTLSIVNLESKKVKLIEGVGANVYGFLCNR